MHSCPFFVLGSVFQLNGDSYCADLAPLVNEELVHGVWSHYSAHGQTLSCHYIASVTYVVSCLPCITWAFLVRRDSAQFKRYLYFCSLDDHEWYNRALEQGWSEFQFCNSNSNSSSGIFRFYNSNFNSNSRAYNSNSNSRTFNSNSNSISGHKMEPIYRVNTYTYIIVRSMIQYQKTQII